MIGQINFIDEMIIDNFAGGGGASTGIEMATGRIIDVAINHDPASILMHKTNHPFTQHYCEDVWEIDPRKVAKGRKVALCWFSPDCKHFSRAKGARPLDKKIRGLAWVAVRWAATVKPRVIILENVEEFKTWGPLTADGQPDRKQKGRTFNSFVSALKRQGYEVDWRELRACDFGAPTSRKRFFLIARCDGSPIKWPEPTHGAGKLPYRTAAEIIDWSIPGKSIFGRKKSLVKNTHRRIAKGLDKFVLKSAEPYIVSYEHAHVKCRSAASGELLKTSVTKERHCVAAPYLIQYHSERVHSEIRGQALGQPLLTLDTQPRYALTIANLCVFRNHQDGKSLREPIGTVMTSPGHYGLQMNFLSEYYRNENPISMVETMQSIPAPEKNALEKIWKEKVDSGIKLGNWPEVRQMLNQYCHYKIADDEVLLLQIDGKEYFISDIALRMLEPRELYNAQGFPLDYRIEFEVGGKRYSKKDQIARCGNSVPPAFAEALVRANLPELCGKKYKNMQELRKGIAI